MIYVDVLLWVLVIVILTALGCVAVAILWVEYKRDKWIEIGRQLEREEPQSFRKTKGARRVYNSLATESPTTLTIPAPARDDTYATRVTVKQKEKK